MTDTLNTIHGTQVLVCSPDGEKISSEHAALDLIVEAVQQDAEWVLVPVERLGADFFQLKTGLAGQIFQNFVNYQRRLVVLGDISDYVAQSRAFRDLGYESNRGTQLWFLSDLQELDTRLQRLSLQADSDS